MKQVGRVGGHIWNGVTNTERKVRDAHILKPVSPIRSLLVK